MARTIGKMLYTLAAGTVIGLASTTAWAGSGPAGAAISCENGKTYALVPAAVSDAGEIITARLYTAPRRAVAVRLIPMGAGYRYAGRGIWLDGIREQGVLNFGKATAVPCVITPALHW